MSAHGQGTQIQVVPDSMMQCSNSLVIFFIVTEQRESRIQHLKYTLVEASGCSKEGKPLL